jgi:hypothetical protein
MIDRPCAPQAFGYATSPGPSMRTGVSNGGLTAARRARQIRGKALPPGHASRVNQRVR